ncbi:hypothetical protein F0562_008204 [Nyssa sinensis]|uniref:Uncharacterized protein n=1 Tax=Nyssa sinensis TaxID=561372 RepID=A0A5J5A6S8_9ASTE|nr:hypothetical protein F0562_008204 [Nyssa sinensis]
MPQFIHQLLPRVVNLKHAFEVWNALEKRLNSMSRSHIVQLRNDFQRVKKDATKSMKSYLDEIKQITDKLAATANLISDEEIVFVTLKGIPREYVSFKTTIRAKETSITFEELSNLLLSEEINISMDELELNSQIGVSTALTAQKGSNQNSQGNYHNTRGNYRGRGNYHNNNRGNYRGRGNFNSNRGNFNSTRRGNGQVQWNFNLDFGSLRVRCQICNKPCHIAKNCWYRTNLHYQPPTQALMASNETSSNDQWFFDSGATHHITSNVENLHQPEQYSGIQKVAVGDDDVSDNASFLPSPATYSPLVSPSLPASSLPISPPSPPESLPSTPSPPLPHPNLPLNSLNTLNSFQSSQSSSHDSPAESLPIAPSPPVSSSSLHISLPVNTHPMITRSKAGSESDLELNFIILSSYNVYD